MKISSGLFIGENVLVDPFMTDLHTMVLPEPAGYLLRAPFLTDQRLNQVLGGGSNTISRFIVSAQCKLMGLFGTITSLYSIPSQLSAGGGFVNTNDVCNLWLVVSCVQKSINLASLFSGKLLVETYPCSFTLVNLRSIEATASYLLFQPVKLHLWVESTEEKNWKILVIRVLLEKAWWTPISD